MLIVGEKDPIVLEFDHRDKKTKIACVSEFVNPPHFSGLVKEIEKCDVRCCNCHTRKTAKQEKYHLQSICGVSFEDIDKFPNNQKHTEESKRRLSEANNFRKKPIERINKFTGEVKEYESVQAIKKDGFAHGYVLACCKNRKESYNGFWWRYL